MFFFFFFQAEDGIRDLYVTGVQTCALPISLSPSSSSALPPSCTTPAWVTCSRPPRTRRQPTGTRARPPLSAPPARQRPRPLGRPTRRAATPRRRLSRPHRRHRRRQSLPGPRHRRLPARRPRRPASCLPTARLSTSARCRRRPSSPQAPSARGGYGPGRSRRTRASTGAFNRRTGQHVASNFLQGDRPAADLRIVPRINGRFTGTTKEILRWAACKWGINQSIVFAQAAVESWWRQTTKGDWGTDRSACPPGHRHLNAQGQCPQSYGILQNRYPFETSSWPGIGRSTAMNADTAYAIWRACYDGYETWLNTVNRGSRYHKGDAWGCVGRWFAGRWRTAPALQYIAEVKQYKRERIWETPDFQQP